MDILELKQIQLYRQHLTNKVDKLSIVQDLCGVQCQFMANAFHSIKIRCKDELFLDDWNKGLVKNWTIRSTVHVFAENDLPLFSYYNDNNRYLSNEWEDEIYGDHIWISSERKKYFAEYIVKCVSIGIVLRDDLKIKCREAGMTQNEELFIFHAWGGLFSSLCKRGFINYIVQQKKAYSLCPPYEPMNEQEALVEQMHRYLEHIAPATIRDIAYFFRYSQRKVRDILNKLPVKSMIINNKEYFYLGELENDYPEIPKCIFLSGFDQLILGYQKADSIYLPDKYIRNIFNLTGIVFPCILYIGNVIGKWRKKNKKLEITLFESIFEKDKKLIYEYAKLTWKEAIDSIIFY